VNPGFVGMRPTNVPAGEFSFTSNKYISFDDIDDENEDETEDEDDRKDEDDEEDGYKADDRRPPLDEDGSAKAP